MLQTTISQSLGMSAASIDDVIVEAELNYRSGMSRETLVSREPKTGPGSLTSA